MVSTTLFAAMSARTFGQGMRALGAPAFAIVITAGSLLAPVFWAAPAQAQTTAVATFAGGCFWCTESDFDKIEGVTETISGYTGAGGDTNPGYRAVAAGGTGHTEAVQITFDPAIVSYEELLDVYWRSVDPTTADRQFCDSGSQYRPEIFVHDAAQRAAAESSKAEISKTKPFPDPIVVNVTDASTFWPAEDYHQNYHQKNPLRYKLYRKGCGRDKRLKQLWGSSG